MTKEKNVQRNLSPEGTILATAIIAGLSVAAVVTLIYKSENRLTEAREYMSNLNVIAQSCNEGELLTNCVYIPERTFCDGNNTMFNFADDICASIPYWQRIVPEPMLGGH